MRNLLRHAIIRNLKIPRLQVVNHFSAGIAHCHRRIHERDLHFDLWHVLGRLLHFGARLGRNGPRGRLGKGGRPHQSHHK